MKLYEYIYSPGWDLVHDRSPLPLAISSPVAIYPPGSGDRQGTRARTRRAQSGVLRTSH